MRRRQLLGSIALGSGLLSAQVPPPASPKLVTTPLVLMGITESSVEAVWAVSALAMGKLEWESGSANGVASSDAFGMTVQGHRVLRIRLAGLQPGKKYRVRAITTAVDSPAVETSDWKEFRCLDPLAETSKFLIWNDTHVNEATLHQLDDKSPRDVDFLVWNGDVCNDWKTDEIMIPAVLHPGGRDVTTGRPLQFVWGNHDVRGKFAFQLPEVVATPSGRPFYAFRAGPVAVICLHTGEDKPDNHISFKGRVALDALRQEQAEWLAQQIQIPAFRDAPYRIVCCHIPLRWKVETVPDYAKGGYDDYSLRSREAWHPHLVRWGAQLIISGHTHETALLPASQAWPYAQMVGGGPKPADATWIEAMADKTSCRLALKSLAGQSIHEIELKPLG